MEVQNNNEIDIKAIFFALLRKWYWFVISCAVCGVIGIFYYLSSTPRFNVDSEVLLRSGEESVAIPGADMLQMIGLGGSKKIDDEMAIMTSRDILIEVIRELDIQTSYLVKQGLQWNSQYASECDLHVEYPEMFLDTSKIYVSMSLKVCRDGYKIKAKTKRFHTQKFFVENLNEPLMVDGVGPVRIEPLKPLEAGAKYRIITSPILSLVKVYAKTIIVSKLKKESAIVKLSTVTTKPQLAIDFINKQIELYNANAVIDKKMMANTTALFINERMDLIARELESAEAEVERYKLDNDLTDVQANVEIYLKESTEYRHRIEGIETQIKLVDYVENFVRDEKNNGKLIPANLGITDESLAQLIQQYDNLILRRMRMERTATDANPVVMQVNDQINVLKSNILSSVQNAKNSLAISKQDLENRAKKSNQQLASVPTKEREFVEKARNKELQQKLYLYLYQKREENALSLVTAVPPANIIVQAQVDPRRVSPRLKYIAVICLVLGLGFPVGLLYIRYILNDKVNGRKVFEQRSNLPYLGELLHVHNGDFLAVGEGADSTAAELFRLLRTNVLRALKNDEKVIAVSSCIDNEGKSYVAANLAMSFALLNKKVVMVELDLRNPSLAEHFELPASRGVSAFLKGDDFGIEELLQPSGRNKNLDILPAGALPLNPNELLQSDYLDQLIAILRKQYDFIILDTAPVAMVSDAFVVNRVVDMTLLVARVGTTTFDMVDYANAQADLNRLTNIYAVLNAVEREDLPYGHAYGYARR